MRISDWSSDVCSSDLERWIGELVDAVLVTAAAKTRVDECGDAGLGHFNADQPRAHGDDIGVIMFARQHGRQRFRYQRSEEHTSELQSLMRTSYAVFCLKTQKLHNKR